MSTLLEQASLVMIPSGYKEDVVYSQIPTSGAGDLSFTRASNGTRINSAGLVEVVAWNDLTYSEDFTNAVWTKITATVTANSTTAPNGTNTATKFESVAAGVPQLSRSITGTNTISIYAKAGNISNFRIWIGSEVIFDLSTGTVLAGTATMENVGNGWYRCIISSTNAGSVNPYFVSTASGQFVYVWGAQLNIGSTAKPYFPTTDRLNVPRLTYQNGGGGCPSLLLEKQSTNLVSYSEQFDNAAFTNDGVYSITANATTSPDGTQNADLFTSTVNALSYIYQNLIITNGATYTVSVFAKAGSTNFLQLDAINNIRGVIFNLSNGTITSTINGTGAIESVGNGWYKCSVTRTATSVNGIFLAMPPTNGSSVNAAIGNSIYLWGAQLEQSSYPTSYIPTTSASATRVADYTSRSGLALTNFTFAVNFKPLAYVVELFDFEKTGGGRMFYVAVQSNGFITFNSVSGGTIGAIGSVLTINQTCKLAFKLNASTSDLTVFINGSNIGTYTTNITTFGAFFGLQSFGYNPGTQIEQIAIFPSVLTDAECISLTS